MEDNGEVTSRKVTRMAEGIIRPNKKEIGYEKGRRPFLSGELTY